MISKVYRSIYFAIFPQRTIGGRNARASSQRASLNCRVALFPHFWKLFQRSPVGKSIRRNGHAIPPGRSPPTEPSRFASVSPSEFVAARTGTRVSPSVFVVCEQLFFQ